MRTPPFLPSMPSLSSMWSRPSVPPLPSVPRMSGAVLRATALELVVLAGHALLYPTGVTDERHPASTPSTDTSTDPATGKTPGKATDPAAGPAGRDSGPADRPTALPTSGPGHRPVVLLHGFIDNRSVFVLLRRSLARHGWHHLESLNYSPLTCEIRTAAELLARHVEEICARTGQREIDIVGHSLGGLIARYYVQRLGGDQRVRTVVTLGTPHGGTALARLAGAHPIARQMLSDSEPIQELRLPAPGCRTRFVSFWGELDQVIVPAEAACVDHPDLDAVNVRVTGIGHLALPVHPAVTAAVRQALDDEIPDHGVTGTGSGTGTASVA